MSSFSTDSAFVTLPAKGEDDWVRTAVGPDIINMMVYQRLELKVEHNSTF